MRGLTGQLSTGQLSTGQLSTGQLSTGTPSLAVGRRRLDGAARERRCRLRRRRSGIQDDPNARADVLLGVELDLAAERPDRLARNREAEAEPVVAGRGGEPVALGGPVEAVED